MHNDQEGISGISGSVHSSICSPALDYNFRILQQQRFGPFSGSQLSKWHVKGSWDDTFEVQHGPSMAWMPISLALAHYKLAAAAAAEEADGGGGEAARLLDGNKMDAEMWEVQGGVADGGGGAAEEEEEDADVDMEVLLVLRDTEGFKEVRVQYSGLLYGTGICRGGGEGGDWSATGAARH